jgi:predicted nucleic acid-binding protein
MLEQSSWLEISPAPVVLSPYLQNTLDLGEASVIQTAMQLGITRVCIDETMGRRVARLSNLSVTGSIGILLKAKAMGFPISLPDAINRMRERGIWLSQTVIDFALAH